MEPRLKYERLSSDLRSILSDDSASCIAVHPKMMMLGTHWGKTHQLDAMGNVVGGSAVGAAEHSVTVTQMSIDHIGENVASWDSLFFCQVFPSSKRSHNLLHSLTHLIGQRVLSTAFWKFPELGTAAEHLRSRTVIKT